MTFHSWLQNLRSALAPSRGKRGRRSTLRFAAHRLHLEALEDRCLLAFIAPVDYSVGSSPWDVKAGDFNGDAVLDLATLDSNDSTVSVLLGNADGTFQPTQTSAGVPNAQSVAVGDFNSDGKLDLATGNYDYYGTGDNDVSILIGNGDGTFDPAIPLSIGYGSSWLIATGNLDGDGTLDLVATVNTYGGFGGATVSVMLGLGDGTFVGTATYRPYGAAIEDLFSPMLADFDNDGKTDVALPAGSWHAGLVKIFLGNGDGTLQQHRDFVSYPHTSFTTSVNVGDFNGDDRPDLVTANSNNSASILLNNGDGTFQPAQSIAGFGTPGDINGDSALDLVTGSEVLLGRGDGSFAPPITAGISTHSVVLADFNADGRLDAAGLSWSDSLSVFSMSVLINDGNWPLPAPPPPPSIRIDDASVTEGNTGTASATFTLTLSAAYAQNVTVHYATADITAAAGSDYTAASGTVTIPAGQTSKTFTIAVKGDRLPEPTETFAVNLSSPTNATIGDGQAIGTILDNEPRVSISNVTKAEGKNGKTTVFTFTVTLSAACDQEVSMSYSTANGTATTGNNDYIFKTGTLTFAAGQTTKTITIEVKGDSKQESNEVFYLDLSSLSNNALFTKSRGIGTILNDD